MMEELLQRQKELETAPEAVREVREPGPASMPTGAPYVDVQATTDEQARDAK